MQKYPFLLLLLIWLPACKRSADSTDTVVARVYDKVLYASELSRKMPDSYTKNDSVFIAKEIINKWVGDNAILALAEENLTDSQKNFEEQLENYKNSLTIYAYERELIRQKLDTVISLEEIEEYYNNNIQNFQLKDYIVKVRYLKISGDAPKQDNLEKWFSSSEEEDIQKLFEYCQQYGENYFLEEEVWLYFEDLLKEIPMQPRDWESFLTSNSEIRFERDNHLYFLNIYDYKLKDDISPLSLERQGIKNLIINKRKVDLINQMRIDVVNQAWNEKNIEIYN